MHIKSASPIAIALLIASGGQAVFAAQTAATSDAALEAGILAGVTVPAADAIAAVETKDTGKVVELTLMSEGPTAVYQLTTLMADGTETNYAVDAKTGAVVTTIDTHQDSADEGENGGDTDGGAEDGDGASQ